MRYSQSMVIGVLLLLPPFLIAEPAPARVVDPAADRIMERVCEQLKSAPAFTVRADISYDDVLKSGLKVQYHRSNEVVLDRPNHLRIDSESDKGRRTLLYDGQTVTVFDPDLNMYVRTPAPDTIDATLDKVVDYGVAVPLEDLMRIEPCAWLNEEVTEGYYGGWHYMDGRYVHHLLFRVAAADFQLWVEGGEVPVLRKVIIEYREREGAPRYEALLSDWNLRPSVKESDFAFTPPAGADRIEFRAAYDTGKGDRP